mmetsp:Transcript_117291/g.331893  ORF Transcript_117291/g.331893 Transcript_117291/m.331893 type:complete len:185 (-) Transcript_117291:9-563(-)
MILDNDRYMPFLVPVVCMCAGALLNPCLSTLTTALSPEDKRGLTLGTLQALGSLGSFLGPVLAGAMYERGRDSPFWFAAFLSLGAAVTALALQSSPQIVMLGKTCSHKGDASTPSSWLSLRSDECLLPSRHSDPSLSFPRKFGWFELASSNYGHLPMALAQQSSWWAARTPSRGHRNYFRRNTT